MADTLCILCAPISSHSPNAISLPTSLNPAPIQGPLLHMAIAVATLVLATAVPAASMLFVGEDLDHCLEETSWDLYECWCSIHEVSCDPVDKLRRFTVFNARHGVMVLPVATTPA